MPRQGQTLRILVERWRINLAVKEAELVATRHRVNLLRKEIKEIKRKLTTYQFDDKHAQPIDEAKARRGRLPRRK